MNPKTKGLSALTAPCAISVVMTIQIFTVKQS
jgi:hypothetical protein